MLKLKSTGPGISTSPLSTTSTSGRTAASSAEMSGGSATSRITAPGLHWLTSSTRRPNADVAVTIRSQSPTRFAVLTSISTSASGVSSRIVRFSASRRGGSIETSTTSLTAAASSRAQTEPIAPVAPTTIALPRARLGQPMRIAVSLAVSSVAAMVRLLPVVTGIGARFATVTPASPTTLVKAPRPTIFAPRSAASCTAALRRVYVNSGGRVSIWRGVAPSA